MSIGSQFLALVCRCQEEHYTCVYITNSDTQADIRPASLAPRILIASSPPVAFLYSAIVRAWTVDQLSLAPEKISFADAMLSVVVVLVCIARQPRMIDNTSTSPVARRARYTDWLYHQRRSYQVGKFGMDLIGHSQAQGKVLSSSRRLLRLQCFSGDSHAGEDYGPSAPLWEARHDGVVDSSSQVGSWIVKLITGTPAHPCP